MANLTYTWPLAGSASANASVGPNGGATPTSATLVGGQNGGLLRPLQTDASGNLLVSVILPAILNNNVSQFGGNNVVTGTGVSGLGIPRFTISSDSNILATQSGTWNITNISGTISLPTGASTSALQTSGNATLTAISSQLPATLGAKTIANALAVSIASDQTVPVSLASVPLPTGAATSALQTTGNTTLSTISGQLPATIGAKTIANALAVSIASDQTVPVSGTITVTGVATSANQTNGTQQSRITDGTNVSTVKAASTAAVAADTALVVAISPNNTPSFKESGLARANVPVYNQYGSTPITTGAYVQLIASTSLVTNRVQIFDSSGQAMILAIGAAASEVDQLYVPPGGDSFPLAIPAGTRVSYKALTGNATGGYLLVNLLG
jgi:hypothetical protein